MKGVKNEETKRVFIGGFWSFVVAVGLCRDAT